MNQEILLIDYAPTERATCKACKATLHKNSLRLGRRIRSQWHDGFDIQYQHFNCGAHFIKHPKDLQGFMDLKWEDIQKCMMKLTRRFLDETNSIVKMYHTRNTCCWNLVEKLQMLPVHHLIAALEYNNVWINDRMKPLQLALIVADGILFGKFNPCPLCDHASLRQSGPLIYCSGYLETSNSHCPMSYTLHNIFEPHAPCVGNDTLRGFEALDFSRKECFLLPPILANCDLFKHWQRPKILPPLSFTCESSVKAKLNESDLQSESESESNVPLGKELLGLTFSSLGFVASEKTKLEQLITQHGGSYVDKLNASVQFVLLNDNFMNLQNTKRFKEAKLWGIPLLHYDYVKALVSRKKRKPINLTHDTKRIRFNKPQQLPLGLILRRRKYLKYYLKAGELPSRPYPMIKTLLQSNKDNEHGVTNQYTQPETVDENAALVTIDPWFDKRPGHSIYRDEKNGVYNCTTLYTDVVTGINKYYNQQLIQLSSPDTPLYYWVFRRWGRVGSNKKSNIEFLCDSYGQDFVSAQKAFEKRALDLTGIPWKERYSNQAKAGRYRYVFLDNKARKPQHVTTSLPLCTLPKELEELIKLIFDQHLMNDALESQHIDMTKMSLGMISEQQMAQGYKILCDIEKVLLSTEMLQGDDQKTTFDQQRLSAKGIAKITAYTTQFYSTIPHTFPVERTPPLLDSMKKLRDKILLLEQLMDISIARSIMHNSTKISCHPFNSYYDALNCTLTKLDPLDTISEHIVFAIQNTHAVTHNHFQLKVLDIFSFTRQSDTLQFEKFQKDNLIETQQMLWHGSRLTNYASILKLGLKAAPENAPTSGYMFGKGIYFADMVSKAAQYCYATADYPYGIIVLAQVALGSGLPRFHADTNAAEFCKKQGKLHTWGVGRTKCSEESNILFPDHTGLHLIKLSAGQAVSAEDDINQLQQEIQGYPSLLYNEYIVYNPSQILIRYIIKVSFHFATLKNDLELSSTSSDTC